MKKPLHRKPKFQFWDEIAKLNDRQVTNMIRKYKSLRKSLGSFVPSLEEYIECYDVKIPSRFIPMMKKVFDNCAEITDALTKELAFRRNARQTKSTQ